MHCPVCKDVTLVMADRQGIEIDYCPQCRGVWLDRGELDKLIERGAGSAVPAAAPVTAPPHYRHERDDGHQHYKRRKKSSFLGEIFDFD